MDYLRVKWIHQFADEPTLIFSELDDARWEVRKVEVFPDGTKGYADSTESTPRTGLGKLPVPTRDEIASDPQFEPEEITRDQFEEVWAHRRSSSR